MEFVIDYGLRFNVKLKFELVEDDMMDRALGDLSGKVRRLNCLEDDNVRWRICAKLFWVFMRE